MDEDFNWATALYGGPTVQAADAVKKLNGFADGFYTLMPAVSASAAVPKEVEGWSFANAFDPENLGTTLGGIGAVIGGIGGIWSALKQQRRADDMYRMEKQRIADLKAQHDKTEKVFADAWG